MNISLDMLLQIVGQLFVENKILQAQLAELTLELQRVKEGLPVTTESKTKSG